MSRIPESLYSVKGSNFEAINLPKIKEVRGKSWIYYGENNLYPQSLIELYDSSAIHHTAVDAISDAIYGEGVKMWGNEYMNTKGETINDVYKKIALDYALYNGFALNVVYNKEGSRIVDVYHIPFADVRSGHMTNEGQVDEYFYSVDWSNTKKNIPVSYKAFDPTDNKGENASQIYYCYNYTPGNTVYPLPAYIAASNDIALDARVSRFHNANISNGLQPSLFLQFRNGIPTEEERRDIYREIESTFSGEDNAGRFFMAFSRPGEEMQVTPIEAANSDYYITLEERITSRILTAHRISSPLLVGLRVSGSGGLGSNKDEIETAYGHFEGTVIANKRKKIIDCFAYILKLTGLNVKIEVEPSAIIKTQETIETIVTDPTINTQA
jgi:hypothetical protein